MTKENYHHGTLKKDMIDKGLQLLNKEGYEGFSLRKLARICGVSHSAPYKHFKNKDELISEIGYVVTESFTNSLNECINKYSNTPEVQIVELGKQYVRFMVENPDYLKFLFLSDFNAVPIELDNRSFSKDHYDSFNIFKKSAMSFLSSSNSSSEDQVLNILTMWSLVHGIAVLIAMKSIKYDGDYLNLVEKMLQEKLKL